MKLGQFVVVTLVVAGGAAVCLSLACLADGGPGSYAAGVMDCAKLAQAYKVLGTAEPGSLQERDTDVQVFLKDFNDWSNAFTVNDLPVVEKYVLDRGEIPSLRTIMLEALQERYPDRLTAVQTKLAQEVVSASRSSLLQKAVLYQTALPPALSKHMDEVIEQSNQWNGDIRSIIREEPLSPRSDGASVLTQLGLPFFGFAGLPIADNGGSTLGDMVPGDIIYKELGPPTVGPFHTMGHVAIYAGPRVGGDPSDASDQMVIQMDGVTCTVSTLKDLNDTSPIVGFIHYDMGAANRKAILDAAWSIVPKHAHYSFTFNWMSPDKTTFRCDGLVVWAYTQGSLPDALIPSTSQDFWHCNPTEIWLRATGHAFPLPDGLQMHK